MAKLFKRKQIHNIHDHSLRPIITVLRMPYIHLTARPQYKEAISEPFTGSVSYIHIIMKSTKLIFVKLTFRNREKCHVTPPPTFICL